jgi:predicted nucleic acid-binding Zn ribbon protein
VLSIKRCPCCDKTLGYDEEYCPDCGTILNETSEFNFKNILFIVGFGILLIFLISYFGNIYIEDIYKKIQGTNTTIINLINIINLIYKK